MIHFGYNSVWRFEHIDGLDWGISITYALEIPQYGIDLVNTLRPRQNGRHFADDTFKRIFLNENVGISIKISLKFVPKGPINNNPALVQIMAWRRSGDKPLSEPMMASLLTHICVTRPQWVKRKYSLPHRKGLINTSFSHEFDKSIELIIFFGQQSQVHNLVSLQLFVMTNLKSTEIRFTKLCNSSICHCVDVQKIVFVLTRFRPPVLKGRPSSLVAIFV